MDSEGDLSNNIIVWIIWFGKMNERVGGATFLKVVYWYIANISISNKFMGDDLNLCFLFVLISFGPVITISELIFL
jgi:hypothetical protein